MPPEEEIESQVAETSAPEAGESSGGADVAVQAPDTSPAPAAAPAPSGSVYDAFKSLPQFQGQDDRAIASRLYEALQREQSATQALQQYQSVIPYASEYLSNKTLFEEWVANRNRPQQQAPAAPTPAAQQQINEWWNPPKVRDAYLQYLVRDENGREIVSPDAPLDAKHSLLELQSYKAEFAKKFLTDPQAALGPMVEKMAEQKAAAMFDDRFSKIQEEQFVTSLEKDNADWLFDQEGRVSREGLAVQKYVDDAKALGINGAEARWNYAVAMVERDLLNLNYQAASQQMQAPAVPAVAQMAPPPVAAPSPQETLAQRNMEYLRQQASRTPSQTTPTTTDQRVPKPAMTFAQRLAQQLNAEGLT